MMSISINTKWKKKWSQVKEGNSSNDNISLHPNNYEILGDEPLFCPCWRGVERARKEVFQTVLFVCLCNYRIHLINKTQNAAFSVEALRFLKINKTFVEDWNDDSTVNIGMKRLRDFEIVAFFLLTYTVYWLYSR